MKILFRRIHLYLAFVAGIVIMITCFTGAILVFEENLQHLFYKERYFVEVGTAQRPLAEMIAAVQQKVPHALIGGVKVNTDNSRSAEISYSIPQKSDTKKKNSGGEKQKGVDGKTARKENNRLIAYVNPYNATVIELYNHSDTFFASMLSLHRNLLGGTTGKLIVGICTLLFLFILATGFILWWPKTKNILRQRLTIKWTGGWKRLNHDLHIVCGFYTAIFLFIFAFTGLAWSFSWFNEGIYRVTNSSMEPFKPPVCVYRANTGVLSYDETHQCIKKKINAVKFYNIMAPKDSLAPFTVSVLPDNAPHESAPDQYFINRYEPTVMTSFKFSDRNTGQRVRATFKPVHTASIAGTTSKIIGLLACIMGVIFPITGYVMWWLRSGSKLKVNKN